MCHEAGQSNFFIHSCRPIYLFVCLFIDNNTVVYGTKVKALTGASDAIKYKRKY